MRAFLRALRNRAAAIWRRTVGQRPAVAEDQDTPTAQHADEQIEALKSLAVYVQRAVEEQRASHQQQRSESDANRRLGWAVLIVTAIYAFFTIFMWGEMRKTTRLTGEAVNEARRAANAAAAQSETAVKALQEARDSNQLSLRPWVTFKVISEIRLRADDAFTVISTFENVGKLPAINLTKATTFDILSANQQLPEPYPRQYRPGQRPGISVLGPGHNTPVVFHVQLTSADLAAIENGTKMLYLLAWIEYRDPLGTIGMTEWCNYYDRLRGGGTQWAGCPGHNRIR